jgi:hypothetical protein
VEEIHLHEAGAIDAIIDIVGTSAALEHFRPAAIVTSPIATGFGVVRAAHGTLPIPAPAVVEMTREVGAPLYGRGTDELITPTGAALLCSASDSFGDLPAMRVRSSGYGAGARDTEHPNVVRVLVGDTLAAGGDARPALIIEANIDDMAPELVPHVVELLLERGAQDAWVTPILMKKGRPAFTLSVLAPPERQDELAATIFEETTTIGVRTRTETKTILAREWMTVEVEGQSVRVKVARRDGGVVTAAPEYEDARRAARATGLPLKEIYALASKALER